MFLSDEFISELKARNDIGEIAGEYVELQRKGKNLMGLCPFHSERTPSFCVYPHNGSFYCFGCGAGGDVITFLRLVEHYDYIEAVKFLSQRAGMDFEISEEDNITHNKKMLMYEINREAARFYHKALFEANGKKALDYLKKRGITLSMIKHFGLGYSPESGYALVDYLKKKSYNGEDIILSNLAFKSRNLREIDRFRNRLMFPIIDVRGNVIAFGARTMGNDTPKYINTSDTLVFKKSTNLFALNFAKKSGENKLILTEGYMDVVSLHQAGFTNAVAGLGTALTPNQVKLMARYSDEVFVSYDSDEAGQKAANRAISMLKSNGINVKVITVPKAKDPDEYLQSQGKDGAVKFKNLMENSKNDTEYQISKIKAKCNLENSEDKIKYLTEAAKILANCQNPIEREVYAIKLSGEIGISKSSVLLQIEKYLKQKFRTHQKKEFKNIEKITSAVNDKVNPDKHGNLRAAIAEEFLISCVINNPDIANTIFSRLSVNDMITDFNKRVLSSVNDIVSKGKIPDITNIATHGGFSFEEIGRITKIICGYNQSMVTNKAINEYLSIITEENKKNKLKDISQVSELEVMEYIKDLKSTKNSLT
jgi:DNA primase